MSGDAKTYNAEATRMMWEHFWCDNYDGIIRALDEGADPNALRDNSAILNEIILNEDIPSAAKLPAIRKLVEKGCDINAKPIRKNEWPAFIRAVYLGHDEEVELLLALGADFEIRDTDGMTPLFHANDPETIFLLLKAGANVSAQDKEGEPIPGYWDQISEDILKRLLKSPLAQEHVFHLLAMYKAHAPILDEIESPQKRIWKKYLQDTSRFGADLAAVFAAGQWQGREKEAIALWERLLEDMPPHLRERYADHVDLTPLRRNMRPAREDSAVGRWLASCNGQKARGGL